MAFLFAVLIAFSRLSSDGEFSALLAAGYSLSRAAVPVMILATTLYGIGAGCALYLEPWGRREFVNFYQRKAQSQLDNIIKFKLQSGVFLDDFLGYVLYAEKISSDRTRFDNVMLAPGNRKSRDKSFVLLAPSGSISGSVDDNDLKMSFDYGVIYSTKADTDKTSIVKFKRAEIDILRIFQDQIFGSESTRVDFQSLPPPKLIDYINAQKEKPKITKKGENLYLKSRFLLHQRIGLPFSVIVFALFAMVLGVQDQRRAKGYTYIGAIGTIIGGYVLMMYFKWLAERGNLSAPLAAWIPNIMLLALGVFLMYQKNRLPPSEGILNPRNIPWINRFLKPPVIERS